MNLFAIPYILPLILIGFIFIFLDYHISKNDKSLGAKIFSLLLISFTFWSITYSLQLISEEYSWIVFWAKIKFLAVNAVPVLYLLFSLYYVDKKNWINKKNTLLFSIIPIVSLFLIFTNESHLFFWGEMTPIFNENIHATYIYLEPGFFFDIYLFYSYTISMIASILIIWMLRKSHQLFIKQGIIILIGVFTPIIGNIIYNFDIFILPLDYDITPILFSVTGICLVYGFFRYKLLDILPIARNNIFEYIDNAIFVFDNEERLVDLNNKAKTLISQEYIIPKNSKIIGETIKDIFYNLPQKEFLLDYDKKNNIIYLEKNKEYKIFESQINTFSNKNIISGTILILRDITEQMKTEKLLEASETKSKAIVNAIPDMMFYINSEGTFLDYKGSRDDMYVPPEEFIGKNVTDVLPEELSQKTMHYVHKALENNTLQIFEYELSKNNDSRYYEARLICCEDNEVLVLVRDVTAKTKAEKELKDMNKELEKLVEERTEKIRQLLKHKDTFINQLGHDLKNPLGPLIHLLPVLEKKENELKKREMIQTMNRNVQFMKQLVTKTIELANLNSPNIKFTFDTLNLQDELLEIIINNRFIFDEKNIQINNDVPTDLTFIGDKLRIHQLFNNIFNNAVKYSDKDSKIIIKGEQDDHSITISIQDTGIGMTQEQLDNVFDEFYKADSSRHDFDSSGLGLPICKSIVEKHGGRIWAESEGIGKGSIFYINLPKIT